MAFAYFSVSSVVKTRLDVGDFLSAVGRLRQNQFPVGMDFFSRNDVCIFLDSLWLKKWYSKSGMLKMRPAYAGQAGFRATPLGLF